MSYWESFDVKSLDRVQAQGICDAMSSLDFGVRFLDELTHGLKNNELCVIGADTGVGKTELALAMAVSMSKQPGTIQEGVVRYLAVEANPDEHHRRLMYRYLADEFFMHPQDFPGLNLSFVEWDAREYLADDGNEKLLMLSSLSQQKMAKDLATLRIRYCDPSYSGSDVLAELDALADSSIDKEKTRALFIDHLHYLHFDEADEKRFLSKFVRGVKSLCQKHGIPVVLVAQLRKRERRPLLAIPDEQDFYGSIAISQVADTIVMLSRYYGDEIPITPGESLTHIWTPKFRRDNSRSRYCAIASFDTRQRRYRAPYVLATVNRSNGEIIPAKEIPHWAKSAITTPVNIAQIQKHKRERKDHDD